MPTREQIERSRRRNRERGYGPDFFQKVQPDPERLRREAAAGPRFRAKGKRGRGGMYDAWGGPEPPAA
jgi:hypothetical protein